MPDPGRLLARIAEAGARVILGTAYEVNQLFPSRRHETLLP